MMAVICVAAPKISEVVQDTKILLRQSREKLVITYVAPLWNIVTSENKVLYA